MNEKRDYGTPVPDYTDENVSAKVVMVSILSHIIG